MAPKAVSSSIATKLHLIFILLLHVGEFCFIVSGEPGSTYYVTPSQSTECPGEPCHTLNYYLMNVNTTINQEKNLSMIFLNGNHSLDSHIIITSPVIQTPIIRMVGEGENVLIKAHPKNCPTNSLCAIHFTDIVDVCFKHLVMIGFPATFFSILPKSTLHMSYMKIVDSFFLIQIDETVIENTELRGGDIIYTEALSVLKECKLLNVHIASLFYGLEIENCIFVNSPLDVQSVGTVIVSGTTIFSDTDHSPAITSYFGGNLTLSGNITFANNSAVRGGALALYKSTVNIAANTSVTFVNNSADKGGAIYVEPGILPNMVINYYDEKYYIDINDVIGEFSCFYQLLNCSKNTVHNFYFANNSAVYGGADVYGVSLTLPNEFYDICSKCNLTVNITNPSNSSVSSDVLRVCICDTNGQPQCKNDSYISMSSVIHPGEIFKISAVLVGGDFGLTTGTIFAAVIPSNITPTLALMSENNFINDTAKCSEIKYSLYCNIQNNSSVMADVFFTTVQILVPKRKYRSPSQGSCQDDSTCRTSTVFIRFTILPCPPGFNLTGNPPRCDCYDILTKHLNISCQIINGDGYFSWTGDPWMNITEVNTTVYSDHCPHNYCKSFSGTERINLRNNSADQCEFNRKGQLCGECMEDYSLAIGSSRCIHCKNNNNLALLIFFVAAGFSLVLIVGVLNLTVSSGTINGLIFYANIIWTYKDIFFTPDSASNSPLIFLRTFIAWINLDFGIETCFAKGLTAFWKTWLQFVFPFYLWAIAGLIILASRHSFKLTKLLGNRAVPLLATLFLLSYMKLLRSVVSTLEFSILTHFDPKTTRTSSQVVWSVDGNFTYFAIPHIFLFVAGLFTLLFLWLPYTMLLFLMQWLRRLPHVGLLKWIMRNHPLYDSYFAPLKPKHHYWFGVLLLARGILLVTFASSFAISQNINLLLLSMFGTLLTVYMAHTHPYKSRAILLLNSSFILNLSLLSGFFIFTYTQSNGATLQSVAVGLSTGVTFLQFCGIVLTAIIRPCCFKTRRPLEAAVPNDRPERRELQMPADNSTGYRDSILNEHEPLLPTY